MKGAERKIAVWVGGKKRACVPPSPPDPDEAAPTLPSAVALRSVTRPPRPRVAVGEPPLGTRAGPDGDPAWRQKVLPVFLLPVRRCQFHRAHAFAAPPRVLARPPSLPPAIPSCFLMGGATQLPVCAYHRRCHAHLRRRLRCADHPAGSGRPPGMDRMGRDGHQKMERNGGRRRLGRPNSGSRDDYGRRALVPGA